MKKQIDGMPQKDTKGLKTFSDEHGNTYTVETVPWANVTFDPNANVRPRDEFDADKWAATSLAQVLRGLKKPATHPAFNFHTDTGQIDIVRGNRRYLAYDILRAEDPKNEAYQFVEARIYRDLPADVAAMLKMDHSVNEKPLSRYGLHLSIVECKKMGKNEKETCVILRGALNTSYTRDKNPTEPSDSDKVFGQYRGFIRSSRWANDIAVLEAEYIKNLKGDQDFPTQANITDLHKAFLEDRDPKLGGSSLITRESALNGKKFSGLWAKMIAAHEEALRTGKATRGVTKLTPAKIEAMAFGSIINNAIKSCVNLAAKDPAAWSNVIDPLLMKLEGFMTPEDHAALELAIDGKVSSVPAAPKVEAPVVKTEATKATRGKASAKAK